MKILQKLVLALTVATSIQVFSFDGDLELGIFQLNRGEFSAAIKEFEPLLEEKYAPAQYQMAMIYLNGWGKKKDPQKAFELLTLAAAQLNSDALFSLSLMYTEGEFVKKDLKTAFELMQKAANKELASAQFNLAIMYSEGYGVPKNFEKAILWYEKAARQNYVLAQFNLALMYFEGKGVKKSIKMSYIWNYVAARSGYVPAQKSRDMDEYKLNASDIKSAREEAEMIRSKIMTQVELNNKKGAESRSFSN